MSFEFNFACARAPTCFYLIHHFLIRHFYFRIIYIFNQILLHMILFSIENDSNGNTPNTVRSADPVYI